MWYGRESVYQAKFEDPMGIFFTKEQFPELAASGDDVSGILQAAIDKVVAEQSYGILYIPEGEYPLKKTVKIPPAVRLIGYGKKRPVFVLPEATEGYEGIVAEKEKDMTDSFLSGYPGAQYMLWFIGEKDTKKEDFRDANAGTFYSALSNIDFRIEAGNPGAVCIRAHFAQHGFVSHCHFDLGDGLAALYDVGNEMEDLTFEGGEYGIICRMTSPGWPFGLFDSVFNGQKKAAILTSTTGFTGFRLEISNTPKAFDLYYPGSWEKLYLEDCIFQNISEEAITCYQAESIIQQTNLKRLYCENVPVLLKRAESGEIVSVEHPVYEVEDYAYGYMMDDADCGKNCAEHQEIKVIRPITKLPEKLISDIPAIPPMATWVSVMDYGAKGDGETDDTEAIQTAVNAEKVLYFPQGIYKVTETIYLQEDSCLYGMNPITTQIVIIDDTPAFEGFGTPKAVLETAVGGSAYINGIAVDTAGKNPRAVGVKWMAGETSYMNDVKFLGGHGIMFRDGRNAFGYIYNPSRTGDYDPDRIWDYQYSSLWITNGGGGIFKDVWSASPYAEAGIAITNTETPGKMYAISLEHHVRSEIKLHRVKNWSFYAIQTEEEKAEGMECLPIELVSCENILFANLYMFRVVAVDRPYETGIKIWDCKDIKLHNVHNKAQMQYLFTLTLKDENTGFYAKSPEYARLHISGMWERDAKEGGKAEGDYEVIAEGNLFAQGVTFDENGNLYWCDKVRKRIYKYDADKQMVIPFLDIHFMPSALAMDTAGNLLVAADYSELKKTIPGQPFSSLNLTEYHPFFAWFYKRGEKAYAVSLKDPYNTMVALEKQPAEECAPQVVYRPAELSYESMFTEVIARPIKAYYMAPDGKTALEGIIDLGRSLLLAPAVKGSKFTMTDNSLRRVYSFDVTEGGNLANGTIVGTRGLYGALEDQDGIFRTVDDRLYSFKNGEIVDAQEVPKDAYSVVENKSVTYVIGRSCIYRKK
uniref:glycosyl hydrolase family 28-related protein n=1 Tax=Acetatifactor sp. TaxID=1872090 RepID=UPI0040562044